MLLHATLLKLHIDCKNFGCNLLCIGRAESNKAVNRGLLGLSKLQEDQMTVLEVTELIICVVQLLFKK